MLRMIVIGVGGLLVAALGLVAYVGLQPAASPGAPPPAMVSLIAAAHPVRAGGLLQPGDLAAREVPSGEVPPGAHTDSSDARSSLVGAMVRRTLAEHDVIAADDVLRPGDRGFLAAVLQPGTRAVSVAADAVSGEAGLIWPGDRIDLILTQTIEGTDQSLAHRVAGETVLSDVRVIAVDQQMVQGGQASGLLDGHGPTSRTITLEVTPHDAARIAVATRLGKLQVVLRAAQPDALVQAGAPSRTASASTDSLVADQGGGNRLPPAPAAPAAASASTVIAAQSGPGTTVWGGDVSHALGPDGNARSAEVRLFQGTRPVEAYKF